MINVLIDIFQAAKAYEKHCAANGKPVSHAKAKELAYILFLCVREIFSPSIQGRVCWSLHRQGGRDEGCKWPFKTISSRR